MPEFLLDGSDEQNKRWLNDFRMKSMSVPINLSKVDANRYSCIIIPHAPGAVVDLATDDDLGLILNQFIKEKKPICAIGMGVAALFSAFDEDEKKDWSFKRYSLTCVCLTTVFELARSADFINLAMVPEDVIKDNGGVYSHSDVDAVHVTSVIKINTMPDIIFNEEDLPYEEEILRNPYSIKHWLRYILYKKDANNEIVNLIYERALRELPGSYKLWYNYLKLRRKQVYGKCITDPAYEDVNNAFERSLVFMHKMPRIWLDYCQFLVDQKKITRTRHAFDQALRALPVTQHRRIWPSYLQFIKSYPIPETAIRIYRRYLKLCPENAEEYIDYLKSIGRLDEAAIRLGSIVNKDDFVSKEGKSNHQLWNELCDLTSKNPDRVKSLKVDAIIRGGLERYTEQLGQLWNSLADYYSRSGLFERARDIYEEAIQTVTTVRDFSQVFDAYAQFEESMVSTKIESSSGQEEDNIDIDLRLARFEELMDRRPLLLNSVLLRQNPHNVHEWHKRIKLFEGKLCEIINTYTEAVQTVEPKLATGKLNSLWISFAKFYDENGQIEDARIIFEKAVQVPYVKVDDLAAVWCDWAESELKHENYEQALKLMQRATTPPSRKVAYYDETETVQMRLHKSLKVWSMYADLEESFGTFKSCKTVYDRILDLRIATPQIIINFGLFLEENNYFEDAFKAYEKGIALFKWPNVYSIWNTYLTKFLDRYGGKKLERARDLLEQCLSDCPAKFAKNFYLLYAKLEEDHGLARHAMAVYDRATKAVLPDEMFEMFNIYIKKAAEIYGITHTRAIYEKAIEMLPDEHARAMCLKFADLERKLGEVDRARAIYAHCSQICDPRTTNEFWQTWKEFEIRHGNEDTMREMLRIKRSVQATYNTQVNFMSAQMLAASSQTTGTVSDLAPGMKDDMRLLEAKVAHLSNEAKGDVPKTTKEVAFVRGSTQIEDEKLAEMSRSANPDEIVIEEDGETDEEQTVEEVNIEQQDIPSEVFGGLKKDAKDD
uniref:Pre-mRNA-splicing factor SYF1 n=1 Tax=Strigamia maritima TaxID=126957 RepID=T1JEU9_STRMM